MQICKEIVLFTYLNYDYCQLQQLVGRFSPPRHFNAQEFRPLELHLSTSEL